MNKILVAIHPQARFLKGTPLTFMFTHKGKPVLRRWNGDQLPNALAREHLAGGGIASLDFGGRPFDQAIAEVWNMRP